MKGVKDKIIEILNENKNVGLESITISKQIGLTYDTVSMYLKQMMGEGLLIRSGMKKEGKRGWNYYYTLNNLQ